MVWVGNLVRVEWVYVQTAAGQSLSVFIKKTGRTKSNCFLCPLGVGDLKPVYKHWRGLDIGCWRMDVTFCFSDNSWHVQNWSGKMLSCSAPAVLLCHGCCKALACRLPLLVILMENLWKRRKNGKRRVVVKGLNIQPKRGPLEVVSNAQEDAGAVHSWGRGVGMQRESSNNGREEGPEGALMAGCYSCWVIFLISLLQRKNSHLSH